MFRFSLLFVICLLFTCDLQAQKIKYWLEPNGHMAEISSQETHRRIDEALDEMETICDIEFIKVSDPNKARIRYFFRPQNQMEYGALGLAYVSKGYILLNSTRKIGLNTERGNRYVQSVTQHETLHMFRWKHSLVLGGIMHPYDIPKYFNKTDVYNLQKKFGKHKDRLNNSTGQRGRDGKPDVLFVPATLKLAGDKFRALKAEHDELHEIRARLIAERDALTDFVARTKKQQEILDNVMDIVEQKIPMSLAAAEWHLINNYWVGTYGYINTYE
jgi:hypothetical protein